MFIYAVNLSSELYLKASALAVQNNDLERRPGSNEKRTFGIWKIKPFNVNFQQYYWITT